MSARVTLDRQTVLNACMASGVLAACIGTYAWLTLDEGTWRPPQTASHYMSSGLEATGARISRDVNSRFAPGAPMPEVLGWFQRQGFSCEPQGHTGSYQCLYRRSLAWNQAAELHVRLSADGHRYRATEARVELRQEASRLR